MQNTHEDFLEILEKTLMINFAVEFEFNGGK